MPAMADGDPRRTDGGRYGLSMDVSPDQGGELPGYLAPDLAPNCRSGGDRLLWRWKAVRVLLPLLGVYWPADASHLRDDRLGFPAAISARTL